MPIKGEQHGYTYKALINGEWQEITIQESPLELVERFEQDEEWTRVRHGQWLWVDGVRCSICNHKLQTTGLPSYCPNCGAKMDESSQL